MANEDVYAQRIREYWARLGFDVDVGVRECTNAPIRGSGGTRYSAVRSTLIGGLPRGYTGDQGHLGGVVKRKGADEDIADEVEDSEPVPELVEPVQLMEVWPVEDNEIVEPVAAKATDSENAEFPQNRILPTVEGRAGNDAATDE